MHTNNIKKCSFLKNKNNITILVFVFLIFLISAFILFNSFNNYDISHNHSEYITDIVVSDENNVGNTEVVLRKLAHLFEFALLGISVNTLTIHIKKLYKKSLNGYAFFYVLSIAVTDEHIQSFSDRTSSTGDIIIDFCGATIGFVIVWAFFKIFKLIKLKRDVKL